MTDNIFCKRKLEVPLASKPIRSGAARLLMLILALVLLTAAAAAGTVSSGAAGSAAETSRLAVSKTEYGYNEPILITAYGSGRDWVGLYEPGAKASTLWVYIDTVQGGVGSGNEFDILSRGIINNGAAAVDIRPGKYVIRLMPDDTSDLTRALETVTITVTSENKEVLPEAPVAAAYTPAGKGFGGGTLSVTLASGAGAADIVPYWSDGEKVLDGYTSLPKFKVTGEISTYTFPDSLIIPAAARELWIYTQNARGRRSEACYKLKLPECSGYIMPETAPLEFQVVSDIHLTGDPNHTYDRHFKALLEDIRTESPDSLGLFIDGDIANTGNEAEYLQLLDIYGDGKGLPTLYLAIGNHDLYNGTLEEKTALFLKYASRTSGRKLSSPHYDLWLSGYHFIFLGNDELVDGVRTTLSPDTLEWLRKTLDQDLDRNRAIFLFIHQSLYDTVAGSLQGQNWNGVQNDSELRSILFEYPELIMFNGHSHWTMDSERNIYRREGAPTILNTASAAYLWTSYNIVTGENLDGSQGYYISVYPDRIIVRGRDFERSQWISAAQYCLTGYNNSPGRRGTVNTALIWIIAGAALLLTAAAIVVSVTVAKKKKKRV